MTTRVLVVDSEPRTIAGIRAALEREREVRVHHLESGEEAIAWSVAESPDLVIVGEAVGGMTLDDFCRRVRSSPAFADRTLVMLVGPDAAELKAGARRYGVDGFLARPVDPSEIGGWLEIAKRSRRLLEQAHAEEHERCRTERVLRQNSEQIPALLIGMIDMGIPGATERGLRMARMAADLSKRFQVPSELLRDLELAARLHELGRLVAPTNSDELSRRRRTLDDWQYTQSTVAILDRVEGLQGVAELVGNLYENWDGTGHPSHWRQGQIPLRCRILRALADLFIVLEDTVGADVEDALAEIEEHGGTRYDPMVLVHLRSLLTGTSEGDWIGSRLMLPITELREGMVLAEDLYTDSGLKLLSRDTALTHATLGIILRRHRVEPILQGVAVHRKSA